MTTLNIDTDQHRYGCHSDKDKRWPSALQPTGSYMVQDGWTEDGRRKMKLHMPEWKTTGCQYDRIDKDPACKGCRKGGV